MGREELLIGRLIILIQVLLLPIYFLGLFWSVLPTPDIFLISDPTLEWLVARVLGPLFLVFPWLTFTLVHRYRLADTYSYAGETILRMPTVLRIFYTLNFVLAMCFFIIPLVSPILAIFSGWFLYSLLFEAPEEKPDEKKAPKLRTLLTFILAPIPLLIVISYWTYIGEFLTSLSDFWLAHLDQIYTSGVNLAAAAAIGGLLYLVYEGAQQVDRYVEIPTKLITLISLVIFIVAEVLFIRAGWQSLSYLRALQMVGLGCGTLAFIIRGVKGLGQSAISGTSLSSLVLVLPFILLELLRRSHVEKSVLVAINAFLFLIVLLRSWHAAEQPKY